jgi:hypothetical protein
MEDLPLIVGRLIGIVVLTIHDYIRYRVNQLPRRQPRPVQLRRIARAPRRARYPARWKRSLPYTGETQRLNKVGYLQQATGRTRTPIDLDTLSPGELWSEVLKHYDGNKKAAAKFLADALTYGSKA